MAVLPACSAGGGSTSGSLMVTVSGLPAGTNAAVTVVGPTGSHTGVVATTTLNGLTPGTYTVQAATVIVSSDAYQPTIPTQQVTVQAGATGVFTARYVLVPATLQVVISGLPAGASGPVTVAGPNGYAATVTQTTTLNAVEPGEYTVTAAPATPAGVLYLATPGFAAVTVAPGAQVVARFQYSHPESSLIVTIDGVYITQGAQGYDFTVPLIPDRPGLLRVFLKGSEANTAVPDVRVRLYSAGALTSMFVIQSPTSGVPTVINEADGSKSWNLSLPEHVIQSGIQILIDVDPRGIVPLATHANLAFPSTGTPQSFNVVSGAAYNLLFIPVINSVEGTTGDVTAANVADFTTTLKLLHPMWSSITNLHAAYTFTGGAFTSADDNFAWQGLLQQIEMLRQVEGGTAYYYGVVRTTYTSGQVGLGYIGSPVVPNFRSAIGWDSRGSEGQLGTQAGETYAHELGHNLGLLHAPCGGAGSPDPAFPYTDGRVGHAGYNVVTGSITAATDFDLMSYCAPTWISDYSYRRLIAYATTLRALAGANPVLQRAVLVSGAMHGGQAQLNPAVEVVASPVLPAQDGPYRLEAHAADGSAIFAVSFVPTKVGDLPFDDLAQFVFTVPLPDGAVLAQLRLSGPGVDTTIVPAASAALRADTNTVTAVRLDPASVRLTWSAALYPLLMVRNANTGAVLTFARGGDVVVRSGAAPLAITASNGVRSTQVRLTP